MWWIIGIVIASWWIFVVLFARANAYPSIVDEGNDYGEKHRSE